MTDNSVRFYDSTMSGAPSLTRAADTGIGVLDACLKDGFGSVTLNSLVVASNVATATVSVGHQFAMLGTVGPVVRIDGATPSGLNGDWRVTVTSTTQFTFATSGISNQTASGTITAKRAPLGFSKVYSGTHKACYQPDALTSNRMVLRCDDSDTRNMEIRGYVTMSDVDTGTEMFPATAPYLNKIDVIRSSAPWWLIGDDRSFYWFCQTNSNGVVAGGMFFGDLAYPVADVDVYATGLIGDGNVLEINASSSAALPRSYTQLTGVVSLIRYVHSRMNTLAYPCPVNNGILAFPAEAWESSMLPRGMMPGLYRALNVYSSFSHKEVFNEVIGLNRSLIFLLGYSQGALFDLTGPWR